MQIILYILIALVVIGIAIYLLSLIGQLFQSALGCIVSIVLIAAVVWLLTVIAPSLIIAISHILVALIPYLKYILYFIGGLFVIGLLMSLFEKAKKYFADM